MSAQMMITLLLANVFLVGEASSVNATDTRGEQTKSGAPAITHTSHRAAHYGYPALETHASRVILLRPGLRHASVKSGETVAFKAGDAISAWKFARTVSGEDVDLLTCPRF